MPTTIDQVTNQKASKRNRGYDESFNEYLTRMAETIAREKVAENLDRLGDEDLANRFDVPINEVRVIRFSRRELTSTPEPQTRTRMKRREPKAPTIPYRQVIAQRNAAVAKWVQAQNATIAEAMKRFNLSRQIIRNACIAAGVEPARRRSHDRKRQVIEGLTQEPVCMTDAAEKYNLSVSTIMKYAREAGIKLPRKRPSRPNPRWEKFRKRNRQIAEMRRKGKTIIEISEAFKVTKQRVSQILADQGIRTAPKRQSTLKDQIAKLGPNSMTPLEASKKFGCSESYISHVCKELGIPLRRRAKFSKKYFEIKKRNDKIAQLRRDGKKVHEIAQIMKISQPYASSILKEYGLTQTRRKRIRANRTLSLQ